MGATHFRGDRRYSVPAAEAADRMTCHRSAPQSYGEQSFNLKKCVRRIPMTTHLLNQQ